MSKIELEIRSVEWKIEDAKKDYEEARENIKRNIESKDCSIAEYLLTQASNMRDAEKKLRSLSEQRIVLEYLAEDTKGSNHEGQS